jgi:hypothetical protein
VADGIRFMDDGAIAGQEPLAAVLSQPAQDRTRRIPPIVNKVEQEVV